MGAIILECCYPENKHYWKHGGYSTHLKWKSGLHFRPLSNTRVSMMNSRVYQHGLPTANPSLGLQCVSHFCPGPTIPWPLTYNPLLKGRPFEWPSHYIGARKTGPIHSSYRKAAKSLPSALEFILLDSQAEYHMRSPKLIRGRAYCHIRCHKHHSNIP